MELSNEFEVGVQVEEAWSILTDVERIAPCLPGAELREVEGDEYRGVVKVKVGPISAEYRGAARFLEMDEGSRRAVLRAEGREARGQGNASASITAQLEASEKGTKVSVTTDLQITGKVAQFGRGVLADVSNKLLGQFVDNLETTVLGAAGTAGTSPSTARPAGGDASGEVPSEASPAPPSEAASRTSTGGTGSGAPSRAREIVRVPGGAAEAGDSSVVTDIAGAASSNGSQTRLIRTEPAEPVDLLEVAGAPLARRLLPLLGGAALVALVVAVLRRLRR